MTPAETPAAPPEEATGKPPSKIALLWSAARTDWRSISVWGRLILFLAVTQLVYEWGAFNESVVSILAGWALDGRMTVTGVLRTGLFVGAVVFATQIWSGFLLMGAVRRLPRLFAMLTDIVRTKFKTGVVPTFMSLSWLARIPISFLMGASFVVTQNTIAGEGRPRRSVLISSLIAAGVTFCIVGVFGGAVVAAQGTPVQRPVEVVFAIVSNWKSWVVVIVGPVLVSMIAKRLGARKTPVSPA